MEEGITKTDNRIVIVGAGPVGLSLALVLARYGVTSLILESRSEPTPPDESRAITWMPKGLEFLDWLGLYNKFEKRGVRRTAHEFWSKSGGKIFTLSFTGVESPHPFTLQLPQHDTETILEQAALRTGLVKIRREHQLVETMALEECAWLKVESASEPYILKAPWAVACDGAKSTVRKTLGIEQSWRDYGTDSAVADFEMECDLPLEISRIILDYKRPYGFFYFAPGRWRFIYRINKGEDRKQMTSEQAATSLLLEKLPDARVKRFLWASALSLAQVQSKTYRKGRWILAGDAAHAMGPSAGAGMMVGVLGAWRLGWRLAKAAKENSFKTNLLDDYEREQRAAAEAVQNANAQIFWNMAVTNPAISGLREIVLRTISHFPFVVRQIAAKESLVTQRIIAP